MYIRRLRNKNLEADFFFLGGGQIKISPRLMSSNFRNLIPNYVKSLGFITVQDYCKRKKLSVDFVIVRLDNSPTLFWFELSDNAAPKQMEYTCSTLITHFTALQ